MEQTSVSPFRNGQNGNSPRLDAMDEEMEDQEDEYEVSLPLRSDDSDNSQNSSPFRNETMDLDPIIVEGESDQLRQMRERKRTLSIKLKETVEAFRRMNSNNKMSGSSGENYSPPGKPPKLNCKMPSDDSAVDGMDSRRGSLSISTRAADARKDYIRQRRQTITGMKVSNITSI